jgi:hypothetical protein
MSTEEDYCGEDESEVENVLGVGGREGEGATSGQGSPMRENSKEHLGPQEMKPFKDGSPVPIHIGGCLTTKRTSRDRVNRVETLLSSLTTAEGDKRGLDVISRDVMRSESETGDKRSAIDTPDTDDDDGCAEEGEGAGVAGPKPEQAWTRNKKVRRDGEARNLSQQKREECQTVMDIIQQIEEKEYKEKTVKTGAWSTGLDDRVGNASGKVGEKRRFEDTYDTGWDEESEDGPYGEGGGAGGEKRKDKRQKDTKHKQEGIQGKGKGESVEKFVSPQTQEVKTEGESEGGAGAGGSAVKELNFFFTHSCPQKKIEQIPRRALTNGYTVTVSTILGPASTFYYKYLHQEQ